MAGGQLSLWTSSQLATNRCTHLLWWLFPHKCSRTHKGGLTFTNYVAISKNEWDWHIPMGLLRSVKKNKSPWKGALRKPKGIIAWKIVTVAKWWVIWALRSVKLSEYESGVPKGRVAEIIRSNASMFFIVTSECLLKWWKATSGLVRSSKSCRFMGILSG